MMFLFIVAVELVVMDEEMFTRRRLPQGKSKEEGTYNSGEQRIDGNSQGEEDI